MRRVSLFQLQSGAGCGMTAQNSLSLTLIREHSRMTFFYPLRLGIRRQRTFRKDDEHEPQEPAREYDTWREGIERVPFEYEQYAEERVLEQIVRTAPASRFHLILGEPGAGKTTLFHAWFMRLAPRNDTLKMGMTVPVRVILRNT